MFLRDDPDASWEKYGRDDPYYGVLSGDHFRNGNLTEAAMREFFATGKVHVAEVLETAEEHFGVPVDLDTALDFGCGVGRLVVPLAQRFGRVTGVDVSASMLAEARRNCDACGLCNVELVRSDDELRALAGSFSFVHSVIVLQHIPVARGMRILTRLLALLKPGGIAALHLPILRRASWVRKTIGLLRKNLSPLNFAINLVQGKRWNEPLMQMNYYDPARVLALFHDAGIDEFFVATAEHEGCLSAMIYLRRPLSPQRRRETSAR